MSSISITSTSRLLAIWLALAVGLTLGAGTAFAGKKRVVVVLPFQGSRALVFHDDVEKLLKRSYTIVPVKRWTAAGGLAEPTDANLKKTAKKLGVDGVVIGKIEKRRTSYIVQLKLRAGATGAIVGQRIDTKSDAAHLDAQSQRDLTDELVPAVEELDGKSGGGTDDSADVAEIDPPAKKGAKTKKPAKTDDDTADDTATTTKKRPFSNKKLTHGAKGGDDDTVASAPKHDDDDAPLPKAAPKKAKAAPPPPVDDDSDGGDDKTPAKDKTVAKSDGDGDEDGGDVHAHAEPSGKPSDAPLSPGQRAIDATAGLSFTARQLSFVSSSALQLSQQPPHYSQSAPVPGAVFDVTVFPLAWGHKRDDLLAGIGLELSYDKVLLINSQKAYGTSGMQQVANLATSEAAFQLAGVFRYPFGKSATSPVIGGKFAYATRSFSIQQETPDNASTDIPNVAYSMIEPSVFGIVPVTPKLAFRANLGLLLITSAGGGAGQIGSMAYYGSTSASGYQLDLGAEYALTHSIIARVSGFYEAMSMTFSTNAATAGNLVFNRDGDPSTQDVMSASDSYFGFTLSLGFLY